jgi:hypothetical protein
LGWEAETLETPCTVQVQRLSAGEFLLALGWVSVFVLLKLSIDWMSPPPYYGGQYVLFKVYQYKWKSLPKTLSEKHAG